MSIEALLKTTTIIDSGIVDFNEEGQNDPVNIQVYVKLNIMFFNDDYTISFCTSENNQLDSFEADESLLESITELEIDCFDYLSQIKSKVAAQQVYDEYIKL